MDYAFQPIVNIHSGFVFGFEVLLRGFREAGFRSIQEVFDTAYEERRLYALELLLREKAIEKFHRSGFHTTARLFFNIDNRVLQMPDYSPGNTNRLLGRLGLHPSSVVFEISERHEFDCLGDTQAILNQYKQQSYRIAIDDFGSGYSGLRLLFCSEPELIKIDRFFIAGIDQDSKKRLFVSSVVHLAHVLGIQVIAEGVETEAEFYACKTIGCDLVQGYLVQRPVVDTSLLKRRYEDVRDLNLRDRRELKSADQGLLRSRMERVEPIRQRQLIESPEGIHHTFELFQKDKNHSVFPVVDENQEPLGIIRERDLKEFVYSPFGKDLLLNRSSGKGLMDFVTRCPISEIRNRIEHILEIVSSDLGNEGLILTDNGRYLGFLSTVSLIRVVYEKSVAMASDQNPLTRLPGNNLITEQISQILDDRDSRYILAYFDIDHFKAFNDTYGFRLGDRAILLFADILKDISMNRFFIGHIGGDDFVAIFKVRNENDEEIMEWIDRIVRRFGDDAAGLHDSLDLQRGFIEAEDRNGRMARFPLMGVSAAVLTLPVGRPCFSIEEIGTYAAVTKKMAKKSVMKVLRTDLSTGVSP